MSHGEAMESSSALARDGSLAVHEKVCSFLDGTGPEWPSADAAFARLTKEAGLRPGYGTTHSSSEPSEALRGTVVKMIPDRVSFPPIGKRPIPLRKASKRAKAYLDRAEEEMLIPLDQRNVSPI